jgi:murein L,D-transpeptidase YafK
MTTATSVTKATAAAVASASAAKPAAAAPAPSAVVKPAATPTAPVATSTGNPEQEVSAAVRSWATAWSAKNTGDYFSAYGKEFDAPGGRKVWEEERKKRILGKNKINVKLDNLAVSVNGNKAQARFKQNYNADSLAVSSRKTLDLVKSGDRWVIVKESTGS